MNNAIPNVPPPVNERVMNYAVGSPERAELKAALKSARSATHVVPAIIGGKRIHTDRVVTTTAPHDLQHDVSEVHLCGPKEVEQAIEVALKAREEWSRMSWADRAAIFLKAAEIIAGPKRQHINAVTMLGQSKNPYQAEIDAVAETIDFLRFNAAFMQQIYSNQPISSPGVWNRSEYRPLEGFVFAVTPFNFASIAVNLPASAAMMGNVTIWKPSTTAALSGYALLEVLEEAGLPPGVINFLPGDGADVGDPVLASPHFSGLHFTGSTATFEHLWKTIGNNIGSYNTYPRIVGETGGKDFIVAHPSADPDAVATAIVRGSFEYQGQKCSASSRLYLPKSLWKGIRERVADELSSIRVGPVEDFSNFVNAVIDEKAFTKITGYIDRANAASSATVVAGGSYHSDKGLFIDPTLIEVDDPGYEAMTEEIFGPVVAAYAYEDDKYEEMLPLVGESRYSLTGAIFARDRQVIASAMDALRDAAGNFYINDKPTGAVVGQQPFGGGRKSGTNDKAGSYQNLLRWISPRSIKENLSPPKDYRYPFLESE